MDWFNHENSKIRGGLKNLSHCFKGGVSERPKTPPDVTEESIRNCFQWLEGTELDPVEHLDQVLEIVGITRRDMINLLMRNRTLQAGDTIAVPYSEDYVVTQEDLKLAPDELTANHS